MFVHDWSKIIIINYTEVIGVNLCQDLVKCVIPLDQLEIKQDDGFELHHAAYCC